MHSDSWNVACTDLHIQWKLPHPGSDGKEDGTDGAEVALLPSTHTVPAPAAGSGGPCWSFFHDTES